MAELFRHVDRDGDRLQMNELTDDGPATAVLVTAIGGSDEVQVYLSRDAIDNLRAALAPYGTPGKVEPEAAPFVPEVGKEYRLLSDAHGSPSAGPAYGGRAVARVRVTAEPNSKGDVPVVEVCTGGHDGLRQWVYPQYLAQLDEAQPTPNPTPAPTLDPRRIAAWERALEMLKPFELPHVHPGEVRDLALFLLGDAS